METGIDQPTLYGQRSDDTLTLAEAVRDRNERDSWTNVHELIAQCVELLSVMRIEYLISNGVKRWNLPEPVRVPRPGDEEPKEVVMTPSQFARMTMVG